MAVRQTGSESFVFFLFFFAAVHVVLVTDLLVFLTERDQKYHLAALQDLKVRFAEVKQPTYANIRRVYPPVHNLCV